MILINVVKGETFDDLLSQYEKLYSVLSNFLTFVFTFEEFSFR